MPVTSSASDYVVLLVDDNLINRKLHTRLLQRKQLGVTEASSHEEAISILQNQSFDMVFVHVTSLKDDPCDICNYIKDNNQVDVPIIAIATDDSLPNSTFYKELGFTDFLSRPVQETALQAIIRKYLHNLGKDSQQVLFDETAFESFYQDISLRTEIIELLLQDENSSIESIEEVFETKDADTIYKKIHYLKGSFNYMKMTRMVSISIELLELLKADNMKEALDLKDTFLANYRLLRDTLRTYLSKS